MTFEEWWANITKTCEVPRTAPFYSLAKMLADAAWKRGAEEGCRQTLRVMKWKKPDSEKKPYSTRQGG